MLSILIKVIILSFLLSIISLVQQIADLNDLSYDSIYSLTGISGHKNLYSSFIFLTLIGSFLGLHYFKNQKLWCRLTLVTIGLQFSTLLLLRTRTVWMALVVSALIYFALYLLKNPQIKASRVWLYSLVTSFLGSIFFIFIFPMILDIYASKLPQSDDITQIADLGTIAERSKVWMKTYELIEENKYWGIGSGNWKVEITRNSLPDIYKVQDLNIIFNRPHNEFLKILSENGSFGLFLFLFLFSYLSFSLFKTNNALSDKARQYLFSGFMGFLVIMFFSFPIERIEHNLILTFLLAITYFSISQQSKKASISISRFSLVVLLIISVALMVIFQSKYQSSIYINQMYQERSKEKHQKVVELCQSAISPWTKMDQYSIPIHWYKGLALANLSQFEASLDDLKNAWKFHPYHPTILNDLGSAYYMNNQMDTAIYFYKQAVQINPRLDDPKLNLVAIYIHNGNWEEAEKWEASILHASEKRESFRKKIKKAKLKHTNK